MSFKNRYATSY